MKLKDAIKYLENLKNKIGKDANIGFFHPHCLNDKLKYSPEDIRILDFIICWSEDDKGNIIND